MNKETIPEVNRRQALLTIAVAASAGIAGCASTRSKEGVGNSGAVDVIVYNATSETRTVSITITAVDAENPHTKRTLSLSPGKVVDPVNASKLPTNTSQYTVEVTVNDGPSESFEWTDPTVRLAPLWVRIDRTRNIKFLLQAG